MMPRMDRWLDENVDRESQVFHVCCETADAEVVLWWMRSNGVAMPPRLANAPLRRRIWFGDRQPLLEAKRGYIVIRKATYKRFYLDRYHNAFTARNVDPFTHGAFPLAVEIQAGTD